MNQPVKAIGLPVPCPCQKADLGAGLQAKPLGQGPDLSWGGIVPT